MDNREQERIQQITRCIPYIWKVPHSVLYIGANKKRHHFFDQLSHCRMDVLEVIPENCTDLRQQFPWLHGVINLDVRETEVLRGKYDLILWSHGPNMIPTEDIDSTLVKLEELGKMVVLLFNWGMKYEYPGNTEELKPEMRAAHPIGIDLFLSRGYSINTIGEKNKQGNNVLAWKLI